MIYLRKYELRLAIFNSGMTRNHVAQFLNISETTLKKYLKQNQALVSKTKVRNRIALYRYEQRRIIFEKIIFFIEIVNTWKGPARNPPFWKK